jgi:hypothetical protein
MRGDLKGQIEIVRHLIDGKALPKFVDNANSGRSLSGSGQ